MTTVTPRETAVWCDGSGTHIQGPACIGVVIVGDGGEIVCEASEHVGPGTNNVAELRAIRRGLYLAEQIAGADAPVTVYSDSEYAIGCCTQAWEFRANADLVHVLRKQVSRFAFLRFVHVDGHSGIYLNEVADWLAGEARRRFFAGQGIERKAKRRPTTKQNDAAEPSLLGDVGPQLPRAVPRGTGGARAFAPAHTPVPEDCEVGSGHRTS